MLKPVKKQREQLPPHSLEAEEHLLSAALLDGADVMAKALDAKVCEESFYAPANRLIWTYLQRILKRGIDIDTATLAEELKREGQLDEIGGYAYITLVSNKAQTTARLSYWIDKVQELYTLRRLLLAAEQTKESVYSHTGDFAAFAMQVEEALRIREGLEKPKTIHEAAEEGIRIVEAIREGKPSPLGPQYSWPWPMANERFGEVTGGELVTLGARPKRGKTSAGLQVGWHWAGLGFGSVELFSREMPVGELPQLFAQQLSGVSWNEVKKGRAHAKDALKFIEALRWVKENQNLHVNDRDRTVSQICARIRGVSRVRKVGAIVIDYLQRYDMEQQKGETRDQAIGRFTMALKDLAVDLNIPVLLLAQLNREVAREERRPQPHDLRESGNIEQDSNRILFVHWEQHLRGTNIAQDFEDYSVRTINASLIQSIARGYPSADVPLDFHRPTTTFKSV